MSITESTAEQHADELVTAAVTEGAPASAVVAPLWNIDDVLAAQVARELYAATLGPTGAPPGGASDASSDTVGDGGVPVAEAVRAVRARCRAGACTHAVASRTQRRPVRHRMGVHCECGPPPSRGVWERPAQAFERTYQHETEHIPVTTHN